MFTTVTVGNFSNAARWNCAHLRRLDAHAAVERHRQSRERRRLNTNELVGMKRRCSHSCSATTRA